ncbi:MAG TPA: phosphoribosyltransferase [Candidatus Binatia bacterium]|nr:phosphoribosyltransferase [Candidatus Binatia bacterium]
MASPYPDRRSAGRILASHLRHYQSQPEVTVLGLPRGGVPVAFEVAQSLGAPLDVFIVRKLGVPQYEELAMGAIASGGVRVLNQSVVDKLQISEEVIAAVAGQELAELQRRETLYREHRPTLDLRARTAILVDDGLATGSTMRAAAGAVRQLQAARIVVAVPVAAAETYAAFLAEVDEMVCPLIPEHFHAVGQWYTDFAQTTDEEVRRLLEPFRVP